MLIKPHFTEKTLKLAEAGRYTFVVPVSLSKSQIKHVVEELYKVNVTKVTTAIKKGVSALARSPRSRRYVIGSSRKTAVVYLKAKQTLDLFKTK